MPELWGLQNMGNQSEIFRELRICDEAAWAALSTMSQQEVCEFSSTALVHKDGVGWFGWLVQACCWIWGWSWTICLNCWVWRSPLSEKREAAQLLCYSYVSVRVWYCMPEHIYTQSVFFFFYFSPWQCSYLWSCFVVISIGLLNFKLLCPPWLAEHLQQGTHCSCSSSCVCIGYYVEEHGNSEGSDDCYCSISCIWLPRFLSVHYLVLCVVNQDGVNWPGVLMGNLFSRPQATALFVVDGLSSSMLFLLFEVSSPVHSKAIHSSYPTPLLQL